MIICGFPGVGKSYAAAQGLGVDLESSLWHWDETGSVDAKWPGNYVDSAVKVLREGRGPVFLSSHEEVRDELSARDLYYQVYVPKVHLREEYRQRYEKRGTDQETIDQIINNWGTLLRSCHADLGAAVSTLNSGEFVTDRFVKFPLFGGN